MNYSESRNTLVNWVRSQLTGFGSDQDSLNQAPTERYPTGVLFPIFKGVEGVDAAFEIQDDDEDIDNDASGQNKVKTTHKKSRYTPPSSVGFSFFVQGKKVEFQVQYSAVQYEETGDRDEGGRYSPMG
jgi:hypothetical protein